MELTAHEQMVLLAWVSCSAGLLITLLCLFPGVTEIYGGILARFGRKEDYRAGHRAEEDPQGSAPDGDQGEDTTPLEVAA